MKKTPEKVREEIQKVNDNNSYDLPTSDIDALTQAYMKRGDVDLALNKNGDVISDVLEAEPLDAIAHALNVKFGDQEKNIPEQVIPVRINGKLYDTYLDSYGVQRFVPNLIFKDIIDNMQHNWRNYFLTAQENEGYDEKAEDVPLNLDSLSKTIGSEGRTVEQYLQIFVLTGFSVDGLSMYNEFNELNIDNPFKK